MSQVGETFSQQVTLTEADISDFARRCGDMNPMHHDREYAAKTRFTRILACGPHYTSLLMGLAATHFSRQGTTLGLEFNFNFRRPVLVDDTITLEWQVSEVLNKGSLGGELISLIGKITNHLDKVVLTATGKVLVTPTL